MSSAVGLRRRLPLYLRSRAPAALGRHPQWCGTGGYHCGLREAGSGPAGACVGGAEKRSPPGRARSAHRELTRRRCLSVVSAANEASWAAGQEGEHRRGVGAKRRPPPPRAPVGPLPASLRRRSHAMSTSHSECRQRAEGVRSPTTDPLVDRTQTRTGVHARPGFAPGRAVVGQWNCSSSVDPVSAFTLDEPPWITVVTSSK